MNRMTGRGHLKCPYCSGSTLHQIFVTMFCRDEGEPSHRLISVDQYTGDIVSKNRSTGNPSPRRQGLAIHFSCEDCLGEPVLYFAQHKGATRTYFEGFEDKRVDMLEYYG